MTQVRHRKEQKIRASNGQKWAGASLSDADVLFHSATRSFLDHHYEDAVRQFQDIQATITATTRRSDAHMFCNEARARFSAEDYAGALPLYRQALGLR